MDFNKFCELFPRAKFVKLAPFDEAELTDETIRKKNKQPVDGRGMNNPMTAGEAKNAVADGNRIGWIVSSNYIVIDIETIQKVHQYLKKFYMLKVLSFGQINLNKVYTLSLKILKK